MLKHLVWRQQFRLLFVVRSKETILSERDIYFWERESFESRCSLIPCGLQNFRWWICKFLLNHALLWSPWSLLFLVLRISMCLSWRRLVIIDNIKKWTIFPYSKHKIWKTWFHLHLSFLFKKVKESWTWVAYLDGLGISLLGLGSIWCLFTDWRKKKIRL